MGLSWANYDLITRFLNDYLSALSFLAQTTHKNIITLLYMYEQ